MSEIIQIKFGQALPPERWLEAAKNLTFVFDRVARELRHINHEGLGEEDAKEFLADAELAIIAMTYVSQFATENCRFVPIEGFWPH